MYIRKSVVGCYYSYHNTCWAVGKVQVDNKQNPSLLIDEYRIEKNLSIWEVADIIKKYPMDKWINKHEPLKEQLGSYCNEVDFKGENENELDAIKDLYFSLQSDDKLLLPKDFDLTKSYIFECLSILLKGLTKELVQKNTGGRVIAGGTKLQQPFDAPHPSSIRW
jgi:hypothetical protein